MNLSIIVPVRDRPDDILVCVDSILQSIKQYTLNQNESIDVIVIDDHSTDDMKQIINRTYSDVNVLRLVEKNGPAAARNFGIMESTGDIVAFTDSDCKVDVYWVSAIMKLYGKEEYGGMQGIPWLFQDMELWLAKNNSRLEEYIFSSKYINENVTSSIDTRNFAIKRKSISKACGNLTLFPEIVRVAGGEDRIVGLNICKKVDILYNHDMKVYHKNPGTLRGVMSQRYRHGRGNYHNYGTSFNILENFLRHFVDPVRNGVSPAFVIPVHSAYWAGYFLERCKEAHK